jgi:hypothetical protein
MLSRSKYLFSRMRGRCVSLYERSVSLGGRYNIAVILSYSPADNTKTLAFWCPSVWLGVRRWRRRSRLGRETGFVGVLNGSSI